MLVKRLEIARMQRRTNDKMKRHPKLWACLLIGFAISSLLSTEFARAQQAPHPARTQQLPATNQNQPASQPTNQATGQGSSQFQFSQSPSPAPAPARASQASYQDEVPATKSPTKALPLRASKQASESLDRSKSKSSRGLVTVISSLAIVLGLFFALVWVSRKTGGKANAPLPSEVCEVLGRVPLAPRQQVQVVRFGGKLLLVCVTANGARTLTEITDPDEVVRISASCKQGQPDSITDSFRQVLSSIGNEPEGGTWMSRIRGRGSSGQSASEQNAEA